MLALYEKLRILKLFWPADEKVFARRLADYRGKTGEVACHRGNESRCQFEIIRRPRKNEHLWSSLTFLPNLLPHDAVTIRMGKRLKIECKFCRFSIGIEIEISRAALQMTRGSCPLKVALPDIEGLHTSQIVIQGPATEGGKNKGKGRD